MKEKKIQIMGHESLPSSSSDLTPLLSAAPCINFTPGVPTEDGWYVVRTSTNDYTTMQIRSGKWLDYNPAFILSHAKLPEL